MMLKWEHLYNEQRDGLDRIVPIHPSNMDEDMATAIVVLIATVCVCVI